MPRTRVWRYECLTEHPFQIRSAPANATFIIHQERPPCTTALHADLNCLLLQLYTFHYFSLFTIFHCLCVNWKHGLWACRRLCRLPVRFKAPIYGTLVPSSLFSRFSVAVCTAASQVVPTVFVSNECSFGSSQFCTFSAAISATDSILQMWCMPKQFTAVRPPIQPHSLLVCAYLHFVPVFPTDLGVKVCYCIWIAC